MGGRGKGIGAKTCRVAERNVHGEERKRDCLSAPVLLIFPRVQVCKYRAGVCIQSTNGWNAQVAAKLLFDVCIDRVNSLQSVC